MVIDTQTLLEIIRWRLGQSFDEFAMGLGQVIDQSSIPIVQFDRLPDGFNMRISMATYERPLRVSFAQMPTAEQYFMQRRHGLGRPNEGRYAQQQLEPSESDDELTEETVQQVVAVKLKEICVL